MEVVPVADPPGEDDRRERGGVPVVPRDGPDRVSDDEMRVRRGDPDAVRHRQLELPGRVLRVELHHAGALLLEGADQIRRERLDVRERDRAVGGAAVCAGVGSASSGPGVAAMAEEELDLVAAAELEPVARETLEHPARERARAAGVRLALLVELVHGRERPSGAGGERDRLGRVRHQPRIAGRSPDVRRGRDLVVDLEDREDRRQADPELDRLLEPAERDRLHEGDAGIDDDGERDGLDAGGGEPSRGRPRRRTRRRSLGPWSARLPSDSEQLQVLGPLPIRHRVLEPGQLVPAHRRVRRHEVLAEELLRRRVLLECVE